jgi:chemotaxis protein CheX
MSNAEVFPVAVAEAVQTAVELSMTSILGAKPQINLTNPDASGQGGVVGIISFLGESNWTFGLILPEAIAPALAKQFAGFDISFDSPDMGDVVGELANVIAGDIVAQLDKRKLKAQMSLPMVARGHDVELFGPTGRPQTTLEFRSNLGTFWCKLAAGKQGSIRRPGM